jgi:hypothetical protein
LDFLDRIRATDSDFQGARIDKKMDEGGDAHKLHVLATGQIYLLALTLYVFGQDKRGEDQTEDKK